MSEPRKSFRDLGKLGKKIKGKKAALEDFIPIFHALIDEIEARGTVSMLQNCKRVAKYEKLTKRWDLSCDPRKFRLGR